MLLLVAIVWRCLKSVFAKITNFLKSLWSLYLGIIRTILTLGWKDQGTFLFNCLLTLCLGSFVCRCYVRILPLRDATFFFCKIQGWMISHQFLLRSPTRKKVSNFCKKCLKMTFSIFVVCQKVSKVVLSSKNINVDRFRPTINLQVELFSKVRHILCSILVVRVYVCNVSRYIFRIVQYWITYKSLPCVVLVI